MELNIIKAIQSAGNAVLDGLFGFLTLMGEEIFFFFIFLFLYWFYKKEFAFKFGFFYLVNYFLNSLIKKIFNRPRPWQADSKILNKMEASGTSFPSGHAQGFAFQATYIGLELKTNVLNSKDKKLSYLGTAIFLGIIVAFSRMYLGQHYLTDVLVGLILGGAVAFGITWIFNLIPMKFKKVLTLNRILIFFIPLVLILFCLMIFANIIPSVSKQILFYKFIGGYLGITCGYFIDGIVIKYSEKSKKWWHNIIKYPLGMGILIGLYYLMMLFYPSFTCYFAIVYFILAVTASTIIPIIFQIFDGLFDKFEKKKVEEGN